MVLGIFNIVVRVRDRHVFMWQLVEILRDFNTLTWQVFWKTKTFLKKLEYCFLVESTKIENKTTLSEPNVKTNKMVSTKWTYLRKRSFASNYFIFVKILFQFKNLLWRVDWGVPTTQMPSVHQVYRLYNSLPSWTYDLDVKDISGS